MCKGGIVIIKMVNVIKNCEHSGLDNSCLLHTLAPRSIYVTFQTENNVKTFKDSSTEIRKPVVCTRGRDQSTKFLHELVKAVEKVT